MTSPEEQSYQERKDIVQDVIDRLKECPGYLEKLKELNDQFEVKMKELHGMRYYELKKVG